MVLLSITSDTWLMTGMGIGVVFIILCLLVLVLQVFSLVAKSAAPKPVAAPVTPAAQPVENASEDEKAAVAVAVYLYLNDAHDKESGILTIRQNENAHWGAVLNTRL